MASVGHKVRANWSVIFAVGVFAFLGLNTLNAGDIIPDVHWSKTDSAASPVAPTSTAAPVNRGQLSFKVTAMRIVRDDSGAYQARVTLDIVNDGSNIARFYPTDVHISRNGGSPTGAVDDHLFTMDVSPHLSQLAPLTFDVNATPGARYKLTYGDTTLWDGYPT